MSTAIKKFAKHFGAVALGGLFLFGVAYASPAMAQEASTTATTTGDTSTTTTATTTDTGTGTSTATSTDSGTGTTTTATSTTATSTTATTTASTTAPVISGVTASASTTGGVSFAWMTDMPASSWVWYAPQGSSIGTSTGDSSLVTDHAVAISGLTPGQTYIFNVTSSNAAGMTATSPDQTFIVHTSTSTATSTATSTDDSGLADQITALRALIASLQSDLANLRLQVQGWMNSGGGNGGTGSTGSGTGTTTSPGTAATISPQGAMVRAGTSIDFTGRGFHPDESVTVTSGGSVVATARADGGGNFSTGSMPVSSTIGSRSYSFSGSMGSTGSASITVTQ